MEKELKQNKKETLEEVAERIFDGFGDITKPIVIKRAIELVKWQQERMYSEEEVGELLYNVIGEYGKHSGIMIDGKMLNDLFEQFKKK